LKRQNSKEKKRLLHLLDSFVNTIIMLKRDTKRAINKTKRE